jgi:hypothetical protein
MPQSLTPEQQFFLHGDLTRPTRHEQLRTSMLDRFASVEPKSR